MTRMTEKIKMKVLKIVLVQVDHDVFHNHFCERFGYLGYDPPALYAQGGLFLSFEIMLLLEPYVL
jgi:hypothetical protein